MITKHEMRIGSRYVIARPGITVEVPLRSKFCYDCGAPFETRAPNRDRCDTCRETRAKRIQAKLAAKRNDRNRAATAARRAARSAERKAG